VSNARKAGVDRTIIMKLAGDKTLLMFAPYNTADQADAKDPMGKLDDPYAKEGTPSAPPMLQAQKKGWEKFSTPLKSLAPRVGLEPTT
jgi:hypothetical protein